MATDLHSETAPVTELVTGILHDAQELVKQQLAMFRVEIRQEIQKAKAAAGELMVGAVVALLAGILLGVALSLLLPWLWPELPVWAGFAIVGGILAAVAFGLLAAGRKTLETVHPAPEKAVEALKENVQWIMKR
jgi:protein-S-isoprenylcysteine O-methyltransferase Ste14